VAEAVMLSDSIIENHFKRGDQLVSSTSGELTFYVSLDSLHFTSGRSTLVLEPSFTLYCLCSC